VSNDRSDHPDDQLRLDLRALDPDMDPFAAERFASSVMSRIARSAALPVIPLDPLYGLWSMAPAFLIAASIVIVATLGVHLPRSRTGPPTTIAEAVGVPADYLAVGAQHP
jgi:hypothetical protein